MNPLVLMALIVAVPTLLIVVLRAKAALVFMALCVGAVLSTFVGDSALDMVQTFVRGYNTNTQALVQIGLLVLPMLLTLLFLSRTLSSSKTLINIFPALLTGVVTLLLVAPLLPPGTANGLYGTEAWNQLTAYQAAIVSVAALSSLAQLWSGGHGAREKGRKKKH